jgi:peptidyl-tRNA hydrolase
MKLYVIVRKDLTHSQRAVQAGHALAEYMLNGSSRWRNSTLIYLGVKDLRKIEQLKQKLKYNGIRYVEFKEPDLNDETTAIASDEHTTIFDKLNLL